MRERVSQVKFIPLDGQTFGKLTVLKFAHIKNKKTYWQCQCSCSKAKVVTVRSDSLRDGSIRSCGCLQRQKASEQLISLVGQQFDRLTVLKLAYTTGRKTYWKCQCTCANKSIVIVRGDQLKSGDTRSCGCWNREQVKERGAKRLIPLIGKTFGRLTVVAFSHSNNKGTYWKCQCSCSAKTILILSRGTLIHGNQQGCGCIRREREKSHPGFIDLTGQQFGRWFVKKLSHINTGSWWNCLCRCGETKIIRGNSLRTGSSLSCGCLNTDVVSMMMQQPERRRLITMRLQEYHRRRQADNSLKILPESNLVSSS